ncbi:MAG: hypothetical protein AAGA30_17145 [Planctomycetota bacterium]
MNPSNTSTTSNSSSQFTWRLAVLGGAMLLAGVLLISLGVIVFSTSLQVAVSAWLVCFLSAVFAHFGSEFPRGNMNFAARLAIQMVARTVPPFGLAIWGVKFAIPPLETSLVFYILAFYFVGLIVDIQLQLSYLQGEAAKVDSTEIEQKA